jgi:hypothetical protein
MPASKRVVVTVMTAITMGLPAPGAISWSMEGRGRGGGGRGGVVSRLALYLVAGLNGGSGQLRCTRVV